MPEQQLTGRGVVHAKPQAEVGQWQAAHWTNPLRPAGVLEAVVYAEDLDAAQRFYGDLLGLTLVSREPGRHVFFRCGAQMVLVFNAAATSRQRVEIAGSVIPPHGASGPGHIAFACTAATLELMQRRLVQHGVAIESQVQWPRGGESLYLRDPAGNSVELATSALWPLSDTTPLYQVDAFADESLAGNPAAVCLLPQPAPESWMQRVAAEMNLSETAFAWSEGGGWRLRWFTPLVEVELCGHATLATAHVLYETGYFAGDQSIRFHTASGELSARTSGDGIELDFPALPAEPCEVPAEVLRAIQVQPLAAARSRSNLLIELDSAEQVRGLTVDMAALRQAPCRGLIVTAADDRGVDDFVSRFFAPAEGVDEDPVTGSAHCTLGPYWAERLGKNTVRGRQVSSRGGRVVVRLPDGQLGSARRVALVGRAVTVLRGELVFG